MNMSAKPNQDLSFLEQMFTPDAERYRYAVWLKSDVDDWFWRCEFGTPGSFDLDFGSLISNGIISADVAKTCQRWLIAVSLPKEGGIQRSLGDQYARVTCACTWIDYLIINTKHFDFGNLGFSSLTIDALSGATQDILRKPYRVESVYQYSDRLIAFVKDGIKDYPAARAEEIIRQRPILAQIPEDTGGLSRQELLTIRAWLYDYGFLKWTGPAIFRLDSAKISEILFQNTLRGRAASKPFQPIFASNNYKKAVRWRNIPRAVPTTNKGQSGIPSKASGIGLLESVRCFRSLRDANIQTQWLPSYSTIDAADKMEFDGREGRFATLPTTIVFYALRSAIEFTEHFGDLIVDAYINLLASEGRYKKQPHTSESELCIQILPENSRILEIFNWNKRHRNRDSCARFIVEDGSAIKLTLSKAIRILYGATAVILGTTMARRVDEIVNLDSTLALDQSGKYLIFENAKSTRNLGGVRAREARPIISIAANSIKRIQRIHNELRQLGHLTGPSKLFQYPTKNEPKKLSKANTPNLHKCLDVFCDYIEMPLRDGSRYYIRQHQLRRFFAMVFFWHHSFSGLDILRWFLGHKDIEQVYRYITESTPGSVLRQIKAQHTAENITQYRHLGDYLEKRFGITRYALVAPEKLESYIEILLEEGSVSIEPIFFNDVHGREYQIIVKVTKHEQPA